MLLSKFYRRVELCSVQGFVCYFQFLLVLVGFLVLGIKVKVKVLCNVTLYCILYSQLNFSYNFFLLLSVLLFCFYCVCFYLILLSVCLSVCWKSCVLNIAMQCKVFPFLSKRQIIDNHLGTQQWYQYLYTDVSSIYRRLATFLQLPLVI